MAAAYVRNPRLVLVDEASLGIAPIIVDEIFEFLEGLPARGSSLLVVDQFAPRALSIATTAYVLRRGEIAFSGTAAELSARRSVQPVPRGPPARAGSLMTNARPTAWQAAGPRRHRHGSGPGHRRRHQSRPRRRGRTGRRLGPHGREGRAGRRRHRRVRRHARAYACDVTDPAAITALVASGRRRTRPARHPDQHRPGRQRRCARHDAGRNR